MESSLLFSLFSEHPHLERHAGLSTMGAFLHTKFLLIYTNGLKERLPFNAIELYRTAPNESANLP